MRIWLQSATPIGKNPRWQDYENAIRKRAQAVARPGTTVDLHGVEVMAPGFDRSAYIEFANTPQIINNALQAEREGYDVFAFTCMLDPGFFELREIVDIPISFAFESACHVACLLAPKFALVAENEHILRRLTEHVKHLGLGERLVPGGSYGPANSCDDPEQSTCVCTMEELADSFNDPELTLRAIRPIARKATENGADIMVSTCGICNMILASHGIREVEGLPFLDSLGTSIKMAELLVDLKNMGIERVNRGLYTRLTKEELAAVRKLYKLE